MAGLAAQSNPDPRQSLATVTPLRRGPGGEGEDDRLAGALWWRDLYLQMGRRLDDMANAEVHRIALAGMAFLVDGAEQQGGLPPEAARMMRDLIREGIQAPDLL